MRRQRRGLKLLALILGLSLVAAACGGDDDDEGADEGGATEGQAEGVQGGDLVDLEHVRPGSPGEHIDPRLSTTVSESQVGDSIYDGLTAVDFATGETLEIVPQVAESWESNNDASEWTFTVRDGLSFSDGTPVLPSSFQRGWETASDPDFAGDYSYLFSFIEGGQEKLDGAADTISGVEVDDDAMTITLTLSAPYANFPAVIGFHTFAPMPEAVDDLADQNEWENGVMVGNGPFMMDAPRNDQEIVLVPNPEWDGTQYDEELGLPEQPFLDQITYRVSADEDTAYNAFEAGEGQVTQLSSGRYQEAIDNYTTTIDEPVLGVYYFGFNQRDPLVGGPENKLLRQAISQAVDREEINQAVYEGSRTTARASRRGDPRVRGGPLRLLRLRPRRRSGGVRGVAGRGQLAHRSPAHPVQRRRRPRTRRADHDRQPRPDRDPGHGRAHPVGDVLRPAGRRACVICRSAGSPTIRRTTTSCSTCSIRPPWVATTTATARGVRRLLARGQAEHRRREADDLFHQAEQVLLNDDIGAVPINCYRGEYVYNPDEVADLVQIPTSTSSGRLYP